MKRYAQEDRNKTFESSTEPSIATNTFTLAIYYRWPND